MIGRGINTHVPSKTDIDLAVMCGCEWIRIDFDWRTVEPSKSLFVFSSLDTAVNYAKSKGLKIYATLAYVPTWLNSDFRACPDATNWSRFVSRVVSRYNARIDVYSIGNEPNLNAYFIGTKKQYINNMLKPGYAAIKNVNSNIQVAAADLSTASSSSWHSWFNIMLKNSQYFDIFSWHTYQKSADKLISRYNNGRFPIIGWIIPKWRPFKWLIDDIRKKKNKRIFLTETGIKAKNNKGNKNQKKFVSELNKIKRKTDLEAIFIYELKDYSWVKEKWGVFDEKKNPKPAAEWLMNNK